MTTHNGERYIRPQLESLLQQTRSLDEVCICDDCSSDATVELVRDFILLNGLGEHWSIRVNEHKKGVASNFLDCAKETSGDIIFFCDQDDVWSDHKVEAMTRVFENSNVVEAVSCTLTWADEAGVPRKNFKNALVRNDHKLRRVSFRQQVRDNRSAGLTLAFSRALLPELEHFVLTHGLTYDLPVGLIAAMRGGYWILGEPLVIHRVHAENASAPQTSITGRLRNVEYYIRGREGAINMMSAALEEYGSLISSEDRAYLTDAIDKSNRSLLYLRQRDVLRLTRDLFHVNPMRNRLIQLNALALSLLSEDTAS